MNNTFSKSIFALAALAVSAPAFAVVDPNWERPIQEARLEVLSAEGTFAGAERGAVINLMVTKRDGQADVTGVTLALSGRQVELAVTEVQQDRCGSRILVAVEKKPTAELELMQAGQRRHLEVRLQDNADRRCKDLRPGQWEGSVSEYDIDSVVQGRDRVGHLEFSAEPEALMTIQGAL